MKKSRLKTQVNKTNDNMITKPTVNLNATGIDRFRKQKSFCLGPTEHRIVIKKGISIDLYDFKVTLLIG
jgi:hypothetical protein